MPLGFLLDENIPGAMRRLIKRHNQQGLDPLDVEIVGEHPELPLGMSDPNILRWCELNGRILVSADQRTLPAHLQSHLEAGMRCPGIFIIDRRASLRQHLDQLVLIAYASQPEEWYDWVYYL